MILADTSVWVEHLRRGSPRLERLLDDAQVAIHRYVIGELALGHLRQRAAILGMFAALPEIPTADHTEVMTFVERHQLVGSGIGWVDAHLLAAAALARIALWTFDRRLGATANRLGLATA